MVEAALPYVIALLSLSTVRSLPLRHRPAGGLFAAFLLLLAEPARGPHGERLAGPSTGLAAFVLIGVAIAFFTGAWRRF